MRSCRGRTRPPLGLDVHGAEGVSATWGFEVEPSSQGAIVRQWARMGPARSGLSFAIDAKPEKEGRIVARRLQEWQHNMGSNLAYIAEQTTAPTKQPEHS